MTHTDTRFTGTVTCDMLPICLLAHVYKCQTEVTYSKIVFKVACLKFVKDGNSSFQANAWL